MQASIAMIPHVGPIYPSHPVSAQACISLHLYCFGSPKMPSSPVIDSASGAVTNLSQRASPNATCMGWQGGSWELHTPGLPFSVYSGEKGAKGHPHLPGSTHPRKQAIDRSYCTPTHSPRGSSARLQGPALPHPIPRLGYPGIPHGPLITPYGFIPPWHHSPVPGAGHPGMSPFLGHPFSQRVPGHHYPLPPSGPGPPAVDIAPWCQREQSLLAC